MSTRTVAAGALRYTLAMEDPVAAGRSFQAVVQARALDELTGEPPRVPVRIATSPGGFTPRTAPDGLVGLLGYPVEVLPALATQDYAVPFTLKAEGYLPLEVVATLTQDAEFPARFNPARPGDLALHREPVLIRGSVLRNVNGTRTPVANATVEVTEIWPVLPPADGSIPPESPTLLSLRPPLHFTRPVGPGPAGGRVRRREMAPVPGEDKHLLADAAAGARRLRASDRIGLAPGAILLLEADASVEELVVIASLDTAAPPELPAEIALTYPLAHRQPAGTRVRRVTPQAPGTFRPFSRAAIAGDSCVFLDSLAGLVPAVIVEVSGGGVPAEFRWVSHFVATSDADGRFRLPPLSRVAQLTLQASAGGETTDPSAFVPDYTRRENRLDVVF